MENEKTETIKGVLIDIENDKADVVEFECKLQKYYEMLHCDCIDIVSREIGHGRSRRRFDIVCDDEGTFKMNAKISAIDNLGSAQLVGSLLVVNRGEDGETVSLTDEECDYVLEHVQKMYTRNHPEGYLMLTQCEY
jgi:hypothetical protein